MPQTVIIEGGENSAREELAGYISMGLICEETEKLGLKGEPCGKCSACKRVLARVHPDITYLMPEADKTSVSVDRMREVKADACKSPHEADCKIYIAENAGKINAQAQNAILKLTEEPPKGVYFVFCCASAKQLLQTVRSRAVKISAGKLANEDALSYIRSVYPKANAAFLEKTARLYRVCDDFDPESFSEDALSAAYSICDAYFGGNGIDYTFFKKKSTSNELAKLVFNILAVGARDILIYQKTSDFKSGSVKRMESVILSDSTVEKTGISVSKANELYDAFTDAAARLSEYANLNAVTARLSALV